LSRDKDRERKRKEEQSYCFYCQLATLYPDGALRCDLDKKVVQPNQSACKQRRVGKAKLYKVSSWDKTKI